GRRPTRASADARRRRLRRSLKGAAAAAAARRRCNASAGSGFNEDGPNLTRRSPHPMSTALLRAPDRHAHGVRPDDRDRRAPGSAHGHSPLLAADLLAVLGDLAPEVALEADSEAPAPVIP